MTCMCCLHSWPQGTISRQEGSDSDSVLLSGRRWNLHLVASHSGPHPSQHGLDPAGQLPRSLSRAGVFATPRTIARTRTQDRLPRACSLARGCLAGPGPWLASVLVL